MKTFEQLSDRKLEILLKRIERKRSRHQVKMIWRIMNEQLHRIGL